MRPTHTAVLACVVAMVIGQGCAFIPQTIRVGYRVTEPAPIASAEGIPVTVTVTDSRGMGGQVSAMKNGLGMELAPILDPDVVSTLRAVIAAEIQGRGFPSGAGTTVNVEVLRFYNDFQASLFLTDAVAEISMNVQVAGPDRAIVFSRTIQADGAFKGLLVWGGTEAKIALEKALRAGMDQLLADRAFFDALLKSRQRSPAGPLSL
jgi:uncharacterized lipoprotein YajG